MSELNALETETIKKSRLPQIPVPTPTDILAKQGGTMESIVSHRDIERDFFSSYPQYNYVVDPTNPFPNLPPDPTPEPLPVEQPWQKEIRDLEVSKRRRLMFAFEYSSRFIRSAMAVTGVSAAGQRFGEIKDERGFWPAMVDTAYALSPTALGESKAKAVSDIGKKQVEHIKKIPDILTDPDVSPKELPGIGDFAKNVNAPGPDWMYDVIGEVMIERKLTGAMNKAVKSGMAKLTKTAYESGESITTKKGASNLLGSIGNDEKIAIATSRRAAKSGIRGNRPLQSQIDKAVKRTFGYIDDTGEARLTKTAEIHAKRKAGAARIHAVQGTGYGPGYSKKLRAAGGIRKTDPSFTPFIDDSPQAAKDLEILQRTVDNFDFGGSKAYTTANAQEALDKIYTFGELLTPSEVDNLRLVFGDSFAKSLYKFTDKPAGILGHALNVGKKSLTGMNATARTLMTTGELSFLMRQGNYRAWTRPKDAIKSFIVASRGLASPKYASLWDESMRATKAGKRAVKSDLWLGKFGDDINFSQKEEFFNSEWLNRVPVLGKVIKGFERGYTVGLNQLRLDWFDEGAELIARNGGSEKAMKQWANYVNNMTGRSDLAGWIGKGAGAEADATMKAMVKTAENVMFAPRFAASKAVRYKATAEVLFGDAAPNALKRMVVRDTVMKWRAYERLQHYAGQNGYEIETDFRSSDALKLRRGNTRFDMLGGGAQEMVLLARIASGQAKDTETNEIRDAAAGRLLGQYASGKLNPMVSSLMDIWVKQSTFEGKDMNDPQVLAKEFVGKFIPLFYQDVSDYIFNEFEREGASVADLLDSDLGTVAVLGIGGAGIQTFAPSASKQIQIVYNDFANEMFRADFWNLTVEQKQDVKFMAEAEDYDNLFQLKQEAGMVSMSPGTSAVITKQQNKSKLRIRKMLGDNNRLFVESSVPTLFIAKDQMDVRLNSKQHKRMEQLYVDFIDKGLKSYPQLEKQPVNSEMRVEDLKDILSDAKADALDTLIDEEATRAKREFELEIDVFPEVFE